MRRETKEYYKKKIERTQKQLKFIEKIFKKSIRYFILFVIIMWNLILFEFLNSMYINYLKDINCLNTKNTIQHSACIRDKELLKINLK